MCNSLYQAEGHKIRVEREGEAATEEASERVGSVQVTDKIAVCMLIYRYIGDAVRIIASMSE